MSEGVRRIGLEEAIAALRQELIASVISSQREALRFEVGEITMEFHVEVERSNEVKAGIKFWVVELGGGGGQKDKSTHKVTIPLKPVKYDGKPVFTGSEEIPQ